MYQFDAIVSTTANYSNFATNLVIFGELTGFHNPFYFTVLFQSMLFHLVSQGYSAYS